MTDDTANDQDLWHVELSPGEVHVVTLDQLSDAFDRGVVTEETRVWQEGMGAAMSLRELLGDEDDEPAPPAVPLRSPPPPASLPPRAASAPSSASAWPPVVASVAPPPSSPAPSSPIAWQSNASPSVRPLAFDVDDDLAFSKPKRRGGVVLALAALLALGGGVFAFVNGVGAAPAAEPVPAAAPPPKVEEKVSHAYDPGNEPLHLKDVPKAPEITKPDAPPPEAKPSVKEAATLREAALAAANSKLKTARTKAVAARRAPSRGKSSPTSFKGTKSGSKYDPLNGAL